MRKIREQDKFQDDANSALAARLEASLRKHTRLGQFLEGESPAKIEATLVEIFQQLEDGRSCPPPPVFEELAAEHLDPAEWEELHALLGGKDLSESESRQLGTRLLWQTLLILKFQQLQSDSR